MNLAKSNTYMDDIKIGDQPIFSTKIIIEKHKNA